MKLEKIKIKKGKSSRFGAQTQKYKLVPKWRRKPGGKKGQIK